MKKTSILLICLAVLVTGIFMFKSNKSVVPAELNQPKFFSVDKILPTDIVVKITEKGFEPENINIKKGQRVVWINKTVDYAWPASNSHPTHTDYPEFDPMEPFKNEEVWAFTFDQVGSWKYHNHIKSSDRGVIQVSL